ncbi:hypothetical protein [Lichenibacterium dinghuense]|uniref:hypothetical protein n=1 Tax=Lichenibacterium dinghuense TaxID=2895977 RepID=UPI001F2E860C|nr:hypothetical protein [Lichenibacterium sp. 6Y81]
MDACLTAPPAGAPADLRRLDAALSALRRAERDVAAILTCLAEARNAIAAAPGDPEAARRVAMAELRMRGDALALAEAFAALARPEA